MPFSPLLLLQLAKAFHVIQQQFGSINLEPANKDADWISASDAKAAMVYALENDVIYNRAPGALCCKCFLLIIDEVRLCGVNIS